MCWEDTGDLGRPVVQVVWRFLKLLESLDEELIYLLSILFFCLSINALRLTLDLGILWCPSGGTFNYILGVCLNKSHKTELQHHAAIMCDSWVCVCEQKTVCCSMGHWRGGGSEGQITESLLQFWCPKEPAWNCLHHMQTHMHGHAQV